jgi:hypothetical protein
MSEIPERGARVCAAHVESLSRHPELTWLQGLQFVRVLRLVDILLSSQRLRKLVQTIELSVPHALNLGALVLLSYFIFGIIAMKMFGDIDLDTPGLRMLGGVLLHLLAPNVGLLTYIRAFAGRPQ